MKALFYNLSIIYPNIFILTLFYSGSTLFKTCLGLARNTITTIDCIKTANIITYQLILIKTIIRYGTSKGNFDIVITNSDIEDAYTEFLAFLKACYLCLS